MSPLPRNFLFLVLALSVTSGVVLAQAPPGPPPKPPQRPIPPQPPAVDQEQAIAYWTTETGWTSELQLRNNAVAQDLIVTPVLRLADGAETSLAAVTIKPQEVKSIDLGAAIFAAAAPQLVGTYGSVVLRYRSPSLGSLYAALMVRSVGHPFAFHIDAKGEMQGFETGSREGIWWLPKETASDYLILTNQGKNVLALDLSLYDASGKQARQKVLLAPAETTRYSIRKLILASGLTGSYGGIKIATSAHAGSLDTLHFLFDETAGFSAILKMFDYHPEAKLEERIDPRTEGLTLRAPMLALTSPDPALVFPPGTTLQPQLFIRNTTGRAVDAVLRFNWRSGGGTGKAAGPALHLNPFETRRIDVAALQNGGTLPKAANWTSVMLASSGLPDEVMAVAASYDETLRYGAQTPFSDQLSAKWEGGMWEFDPYHDSIITAGNGGIKPTQAAFTIFYNQGTQRYDLEQTLQPDEQMWIDVGKLIREQVPDKNGKVLPADLTSGSYEFRDLTDFALGALFEGKVIYDKTYGHVAYGCANCCGTMSTQTWFNPLGVPSGSTAGQGVNGYNNCELTWDDLSSYFYSDWTAVNTAIATVDYYGTHTGVSAGSTRSSSWANMREGSNGLLCPRYRFTPSGGVTVTPKIMLGGCSGTNITGTTQSVVVGQQISLCASYGNISANSQSWTAPGTIVGGFSTAPTNGGPNPINLNGQSTTFYWAASGSSTVTFTLNYASNQIATAQATFNIAGPTSPLITASLGNWKIGTGPNLQLGDVTSTPGITFVKSATPPLGYPGAFEWVQVITESNIACIATKNVNETPGLDSSYPYSSSSTASDTPSIPLASADSQITWNFAANMYLMWRPGLTNDIYVPLGYVTWQFFGDASQSGTWTVQSDSTRSANAFVQSSSYPTWTSTLATNGPPPCP